ncbi:MAG: protein kinase [Polyangiaceae bacterium]|nr:protein kinase [Polyangiaceae bacterium]
MVRSATLQGPALRPKAPLIIGRYALYDELASGGMASVFLARLLGPVGFSRTVAIKRMHPQFAKEPEFVSMFIDEARLAARIRHPNVVPTLDVVCTDGELFLVMEYVQGESLSRLMKRAARATGPMDPKIALPILIDALQGLEAAHNATTETGAPLNIVHRDVSPQNIMVGVDGAARVFDFGIAKASGRLHTTRDGVIKGKLAYMAPEQLTGKVVTPHADLYAAAVVLWEALAGRRLFDGEHEAQVIHQILDGVTSGPRAHNPTVSPELDAIVLRALCLDPTQRFPTAKAMAEALEALGQQASPGEIGAWVTEHAGPSVVARANRIREIESDSTPFTLGSLEMNEASGPRAQVVSQPDTDESATFSSNSASRAVEKRGRWNGPAAPLLVSVALLAAGGVAYLVMRPSRESAGDDTAKVESASAVSAVAEAAPSATGARVVVAPSAAPTDSASAARVTGLVSAPSTTARNVPVASGPTSKPAPTTANTARPAPTSVPNPCVPPYYFDAEGIKHPKPQCL